MNRKSILIAAVVFCMLPGLLEARIKLTTLPERETVRIDIQNGRHTLVEEERVVNLQQGANQVDFSWANIGIDKESIVFRVIDAPGKVNVINTNYPPNENALYWTVSAETAGPAVIRISYLIGNMSGMPSYQGIVENDEKSMLLQVYMTVTNTSGESFGETTIQPGVGKTTVEYFNNGERKQMLAAKFANVPIEKRYVFDPQVDSGRTRMYYHLVNDKENSLGQFPLPYGKIRLFIQEPTDDDDTTRSQAFLGEDWAKYTPMFMPMDLYVGVAQDVKLERFVMPFENGPSEQYIEMKCERTDADGKRDDIEPQFRHERTRLRYRLQNFKTENGEPVSVPLVIKEQVDGEWEIEKIELKQIDGERNDQSETVIPHAEMVKVERKDIGNVELLVDLPPTTIEKKYDLYVTILRKWRRY